MQRPFPFASQILSSVSILKNMHLGRRRRTIARKFSQVPSRSDASVLFTAVPRKNRFCTFCVPGLQ